MDSSTACDLSNEKKLPSSDQQSSAPLTGSSSILSLDKNGPTKVSDPIPIEKKPIDVDELLKKLEEDDKILKELEELEKRDRLTTKKLSTTATSTNNLSTNDEVTFTRPKSTSTSASNATVTAPEARTVSKSTSTDLESSQHLSPSPSSSISSPHQPLTTGTTIQPIVRPTARSVSTTSTNTSSTLSESVSTLSDYNPSNLLNRLNQLALTSYGLTGGLGNLSTSMPSLLEHHQAIQLLTSHLQSKQSGASISPQELDQIMEKLEHDNRILAELDQKVKLISSSTNPSNISSPVFLSSSLPTLTGLSHPGLLSTLYPQLFPALASDRNRLARDKRLMLPNHMNSNSSTVSSYFEDDIEQIQLLQALIKSQQQELQFAADMDTADCIEIPNRGRCRIYIARYSYDPFKQSPNENPESELYLAAGDFILVFGDMDDDGFYFGELLDGRRGLVPSNFVEKLTGEDLYEFQASILYETRDGDESTCSYPPEFYDALLDDVTSHSNFQHLFAPEDFHRMNDYIELCQSSDIDEEDLSDPERAQATAAKDSVPPPKRLILERQLHKSILVGWLPPDCPKIYIDNYQIYVDGVLKVTVPSNERTRALVEGVESSIPHRISVRTITPQGKASRDAACTIVVGKNVPFAPCCVKSNNITATSALISWLPSNSNFNHVVAVNSVEVKVVGPSIYKHLITGLSPNTLYRVSVRAKPGKLLCSEEKNPKKLEMLTTFVDLRTLPKSLPEPPVDVQIESGPQNGTLLVTWLPVTLDQFGSSNGCPVTGYAVFSAHKKLAEIDSPTSDHALFDISQIESFHKKAITVRTKSGENLSQDSIPCQIPEDLIKFNANLNQNSMTNNNPNVNNNINLINNNNLRKTQNSPSRRGGPGMVQNRGPSRTGPNSAQPPQPINRQPNSQQQFHQQQHPGNRNSSQQQSGFQQAPNMSNNQSGMPNQSMGPNRNLHSDGKRVMGVNRASGPSPQPPQRTRQYTDHERSHLGPGRGVHGPGSGPQNKVGPNRQQLTHGNQRDVRFFVALYDYDPLTMSPNPDAANEELPFREGDIIKIYGDKDPDGFYRGELNERMGFVPCNMISEVQYDPETGAPTRIPAVSGPTMNTENDPWSHLPVKKMIALYDYDPQELSPNSDAEMELAFYAGDHIYVYGDLDEDGFYLGESNGNRGLVPSNFLTEAIDGTARHGTQNQLNNRGQSGDSRPPSQHQNHQQQPLNSSAPFQGQIGPHQQRPQINQSQQHHQLQQQQPFNMNQSNQQSIHQQQSQQQHPIQAGQGYGQNQFQGQQQQQRQIVSSNQQKMAMSTTNPIGHQQQLGMRPQGNYGAQSMHQQYPGQQLGPQQRPNSLELRSNQGIQGANPLQHQNQQQQSNQMGHQQNQFNQFQQHPSQQMLTNQTNTQSNLNQHPSQSHQQQQQQRQQLHQQQSNGLNPTSNLLNSGKQMLPEATTPRSGQPVANFDPQHGPMSHHQQHSNQSHQLQPQQRSMGGISHTDNNRFGLSQNQQQSHFNQSTGQQNYLSGGGQQGYNSQSQQSNRSYGYPSNQVNSNTMMGTGNMNPGQNQQNLQGPTLSGALGAVKSIFKI